MFQMGPVIRAEEGSIELQQLAPQALEAPEASEAPENCPQASCDWQQPASSSLGSDETGVVPPTTDDDDDTRTPVYSPYEIPKEKGAKKRKNTPKKNLRLSNRDLWKYKRSSELEIPYQAFFRLVKEIASDKKDNIKIRVDAISALQIGAESFLTSIFEDASMCSIHAHRKTLTPKDLALALRFRKPFSRSRWDKCVL